MSLPTFLATLGVALLLLAFGANLSGRLSPSSRVYQGLNAIGAALACAASALIGFVPFVVLEGAWAMIGLLSLLGVPLVTNRASSD